MWTQRKNLPLFLLYFYTCVFVSQQTPQGPGWDGFTRTWGMEILVLHFKEIHLCMEILALHFKEIHFNIFPSV